MTKTERAAADKVRLAKLKPAWVKIRAEKIADFEAKWNRLRPPRESLHPGSLWGCGQNSKSC